MFRLLGCVVVVAAAASAADYGQYYQDGSYYSSTPYPIDHNEGPYPHEKIGPNTNLFFSFEQTRKDQPSQIETREENIHQYRYRAKSTTTPAPMRPYNDYVTRAPYQAPEYQAPAYQAPTYQAPSYQPSAYQAPEYKAPAYQAPEYQPPAYQVPAQQSLTYEGPEERRSSRPPKPSTTMAPPPPPPRPKWVDEEIRGRPYSQYNPAPRIRTTPVPMNQWSGPSHQDYSHHTQSQPRFTHPIRVADIPSTTTRPHWTEIQAASESPRYQGNRNPQHHQSSSGRGNHKFNWNDVSMATEDVYKAAVTPAPRTREPPSAVPTLTPWSGDNF